MKILILLLSIFIHSFAINITNINEDIDQYKSDSKKEKLSYKDLIYYLENSGDKNKIMILGILYANGTPEEDDFGYKVGPDPLLSLKFLEKSYQMGNPRALSVLGALILYNDHMSILDKSLDKTENYLNLAIKGGDKEAKLLLGNTLLLKYKYDEALMVLKEASEDGDSSASLQLAFLYIQGIYSEKHDRIMLEKNIEAANYFLNIACNSKEKNEKVREVCFSENVETITN